MGTAAEHTVSSPPLATRLSCRLLVELGQLCWGAEKWLMDNADIWQRTENCLKGQYLIKYKMCDCIEPTCGTQSVQTFFFKFPFDRS